MQGITNLLIYVPAFRHERDSYIPLRNMSLVKSMEVYGYSFIAVLRLKKG